MDAISNAVGGMGAAVGRLDAIAAQVAGVGSLDEQVNPSNIVGQLTARDAFEANAKVIAVAERMVGAVLDIRA